MTWFKPKTHGYGASPANWKGWAATFGFLVLELVLVWVLLLRPILAGGEPTINQLVVWGFCSGALTVGFVWLTKAKTDGDWRWRWGKED
ncbi:hypothetical protein [Albidovulum sp.]|uniref:hypothetical protein n=1 Tax=Albidovulum sp. TaxID=1872424 RepID=UPI001DDC5993|nr:hypothetical protein [Paracoccaceae bacterium]HPE25287.1 hypothetical protein [Albidovulum sp.]MCB2118946.1 hypothetical protein [Paracoccaceae bacterium]MCB2133395.1 hypothetical protein [Paracoccaceae bacterium]MCB2144717.1 hypothetical protein [Paracoccaceae bacterium]